MWDVVTGKQLYSLQHHRDLIRDVSWHPYEPLLNSVSWDGSCVAWAPPGVARQRSSNLSKALRYRLA